MVFGFARIVAALVAAAATLLAAGRSGWRAKRSPGSIAASGNTYFSGSLSDSGRFLALASDAPGW
jgi:hypothetical protein